MRVLSFAMAILLLVAMSASTDRSGVLAARSPGVVLARTSSRGALPAAQQPRKAGSDGPAASLDASGGKPAVATSSPPPTVFDADRMSKRRVRRGSDPIHNKC